MKTLKMFKVRNRISPLIFQLYVENSIRILLNKSYSWKDIDYRFLVDIYRAITVLYWIWGCDCRTLITRRFEWATRCKLPSVLSDALLVVSPKSVFCRCPIFWHVFHLLCHVQLHAGLYHFHVVRDHNHFQLFWPNFGLQVRARRYLMTLCFRRSS